MAAQFEETKHYINDPKGPAIVRFYPGNHGYYVTDPRLNKKNSRTGGATSITGMLGKGDGLMEWPMWEMSKYLKAFFENTTVMQLVDGDLKIEDILKAGRDAHTNKSDRGKSVGTDAHAWVEAWSKAQIESYKSGEDPVVPPIPEVEDIAVILRRRYLEIIKALKPKELADWRRLPQLIAKDIDMQEAIWTEADMVRNSILAAKEWIDKHEIVVHGAEDTVYWRSAFTCGKYDGDWTVTCGPRCNWCYLNGAEHLTGDEDGETFTGRYVVDFKSTNASTDAPKGIYPEYLVQCAIYDWGITEEFPDREYHGYLILNGSKVQSKDKEGNLRPLFNSHFSFERERYRRAALNLASIKEDMFEAGKEIKSSR